MADYTVSGFAKVVNMHPVTARRLIREGKIEGAYRIGGVWRVRDDAVEAMRGAAVDTREAVPA